MLTAQGEVHRTLALQAGVAVVGRTAFGLDAYRSLVVDFALIVIHIEVFQRQAVAVLPVVAVVEDALEGEFVVGVDHPV